MDQKTMTSVVHVRTQIANDMEPALSGDDDGRLPRIAREHSARFSRKDFPTHLRLVYTSPATLKARRRESFDLTVDGRAKQGGWSANRILISAIVGCSRGLRALGRGWRGRRIASDLHALDDRILEDIGITRCEITFVSRSMASVPCRLDRAAVIHGVSNRVVLSP